MGLPDVSVTVEDGALGLAGETTDSICVKLGISSQGPQNTLLAFSDKKGLVDTLGSGPLLDAAALSLDTAGGPVYCVRPNASSLGTTSRPVHTGTQTAALVVTGAPLDQYDVQVTVSRDGANLAANTAAFTHSLDGGDSVSGEIAVPLSGSYPVPNTGLTLTFRDGTFVTGDLFTFTTTAPGFSLQDLTTAVNALLQDPRTWGFLHVIGPAATAQAAAALVSSLDTLMASAEQAYRYAFAVIEVPEDTDANLIAAFRNASSKRVMACAGMAEVVSPVSGLIRKRSSAWPITARIAKAPIHEDLGRVRSGPVVGVSSLYRDEQQTPGLDGQRFSTLRTIIGTPGYWITNGRMLSPSGSDFLFVQYRRVMDRACSVARNALVKYLNDSLRLDPVSGFILESEARAIEADVGGQLGDALVAEGHASSVSILVSRTANIGSTQTLPVTIRVQPLGYAKFISVDIGFRNPAREPAAA